jgi:hypothetical protein
LARRKEQLGRALEVTNVARPTRLLRVVREIGVSGSREASPVALDWFWKILRTRATCSV